MTLEYDIGNVCFICGFSKEDFHHAHESFTLHTKRTHYLWNYVFFVVGLKEKDNELQNGIESAVELKLINNDLSWFPFKKTRLVDEMTEDGDDLAAAIDDLEKAVDGMVPETK